MRYHGRGRAIGSGIGLRRKQTVMAEKHVVFALIEPRAQVAGELKNVQVRVAALKADLAAIDVCVRMFKPEYKVEVIEAKVTNEKNPAVLPKGTGSRKALEILRQSGEVRAARR
jgi:hypothetical protein